LSAEGVSGLADKEFAIVTMGSKMQAVHQEQAPLTRNALVVGGSGLLGGNLIRRLGDTPYWRVKSLSRRPAGAAVPVRHVAADLLDPTQLHARAAEFSDVTHLFFCSRAVTQGYAISVDANTVMLENLLDVLVPVAPGLQHVQLVHGLKWYGSHVGPIKLPAKETDPPQVDSSFYQNQQDMLVKRQAGQAWNWSTVRPHFICAVTTDSPSNLVAVLGTFAAILRELGQDLWFPGSEQAFDAITNVADIDLLTKCMVWAATDPRCANNAFNVANGDCFRWRDVWPRIARAFGMAPGGVQPTDLVRFMADKSAIWDAIVSKHRLRSTPFAMMADWSFAKNNVFGLTWDVFASTVKAHRFGFPDMIDSEEMFDRLFARYRALQILP
jgi:nucleoside-diphosphate-sugar epimerase